MSTKVFIGGSRRISRINPLIRARLDKIVEQKLPVLIGDANGADKAVQAYLKAADYPFVEVFCMEGKCRNNLGDWKTRDVMAPPKVRGFAYYSLKDEQMSEESSVGLMLWDGVSRGTLANVSRMICQNKKVVVYIAPRKLFEVIRDSEDLNRLIASCEFVDNHSGINKHSRRRSTAQRPHTAA
jgi:hypothetical protein